MDIEIFTLCDHAQDFGGKLVIIGTFDTITAPVFPAVHAALSIAARIRFLRTEAGLHKINILVVNEDGKEILPPFSGDLTVNPPPQSESMVVNFCLDVGRLTFEKPGRYGIDLIVDGVHQRSLPLLLFKRP
jgi:hypothetical protein